MYGPLYKVVHEGGDGGVQHEGDQEEEPEHADDGKSAQEEGGVVLDVLQPALGLLGVLPHGGVSLCHGGCGVERTQRSETGGRPPSLRRQSIPMRPFASDCGLPYRGRDNPRRRLRGRSTAP